MRKMAAPARTGNRLERGGNQYEEDGSAGAHGEQADDGDRARPDSEEALDE